MHFLGRAEEQFEEDEYYGDDGLGYYEDGTKRTLTDEQIAIFRHSEIESLLRSKRRAGEEKVYNASYEATKPPVQGDLNEQYNMPEDCEDGEIDDVGSNVPALPASGSGKRMSKKEKKAHKAKQMGLFKQQAKPDLRKRTWDKVDTGLGSLSYDDNGDATKTTVENSAQRRRISYDD